MRKAAPESRAATGAIAALWVHISLLALVLRDRPFVERELPRRAGELVFIQPAPPIQPLPRQDWPPVARQNSEPGQRRTPAPLVDAPPPALTDVTPTQEPFETPRKLDMEALVKDAGRADRDARPAGENTQYGPVPDSMRSVLSKAFTEAKLAVPLKWYEAARIELFSEPNDPKKIYQVKTAFGTYCLFYPDPRNIDGGAQAMQPKAGNCPVRF